LRKFDDAGVDQVAFIQQGGKNRHEHICEALELFAADVMPEFKERAADKRKRKMEELAPYIEKAFARKVRMRELSDDEIPNVVALGRMITQPTTQADGQSARRFSDASAVPLEDPLAKKSAVE
jgi:hypothetical protein